MLGSRFSCCDNRFYRVFLSLIQPTACVWIAISKSTSENFPPSTPSYNSSVRIPCTLRHLIEQYMPTNNRANVNTDWIAVLREAELLDAPFALGDRQAFYWYLQRLLKSLYSRCVHYKMWWVSVGILRFIQFFEEFFLYHDFHVHYDYFLQI